MTHLVTDNCVMCKHTDCVSVCPVDCFYEGPNFLAINPDECIDCGICVPECPASAIFLDEDLPAGEREKWFEINDHYSKQWPQITEQIEPMEDWALFDGEEDKFDKYFEE